MAHQFESGFVVRDRAWHGLATVLPENPSVAVALKAAGLDWDVLECPMKTLVPAPNQPGEPFAEKPPVLTDVPEGKVLLRSTDRSVLGFTTSKYNAYQNRDIFGWFQELIDDGTAVLETAGSLQSGRKVWVQARYGDTLEVKDGDAIIPYLLLAAGHDGKMAIRIQNTPIRVVCWNTMQAAGVGEDGDLEHSVKSGLAISHKGDVKAKAEAARRTIVSMNRDLQMSVDTYRRMTKLPVTEEYVRSLAKELFDPEYLKARDLINKFRERQEFAAVDIKAETAAKIEELEKLLNSEGRVERKVVEAFHNSPGCEGKSAWDAFNAITYQIDHGAKGSVESRMGSSWFGTGSRKRARAFELISGSAGM